MGNETGTMTATRTSWKIDPTHSDIEFQVKHLMVAKVKGRFAGVSGTIEIDESDVSASKVDVTIDTATVDTRDEKRDAHLRSADFFDVEKFPMMTFQSRKVERKGDRLRVTGDLTIHGVTREVVLDVEENGRQKDPWGGERAAFTATTTIDRHDYGLEWNVALEAGGVMVSREVKITLEIEAVRANG
jgi:polyisoprenoid-binding protein YceI